MLATADTLAMYLETARDIALTCRAGPPAAFALPLGGPAGVEPGRYVLTGPGDLDEYAFAAIARRLRAAGFSTSWPVAHPVRPGGSYAGWCFGVETPNPTAPAHDLAVLKAVARECGLDVPSNPDE